MSDANGTMVGGAMAIPVIDKFPGANGEFIPAVGIADL